MNLSGVFLSWLLTAVKSVHLQSQHLGQQPKARYFVPGPALISINLEVSITLWLLFQVNCFNESLYTAEREGKHVSRKVIFFLYLDI